MGTPHGRVNIDGAFLKVDIFPLQRFDFTDTCTEAERNGDCAGIVVVQCRSSLHYKGWRVDENVRYFNSIFMDIDDVNGMDFSSMTTAQMREWLMKTYELPEEMLPEISVSSGHGLHLYYLVDELDMLKEEHCMLRKKYTDYSGNRDIERLEYFRASNEEIGTYMKQRQEEKNEKKARTTRERNKKALKTSMKEPALKSVSVKKNEKQKPPEKAFSVPKGSCLRKIDLPYYTNFSKRDRYWNMVKDFNRALAQTQGKTECGRKEERIV